MQKKTLEIIGIILVVFVAVGFVSFLGITQIVGVPLWWTFRNIHEMSVIGLTKLLIEVAPEAPMNIGDEITVTVTNSSSKLPVQDAEVDVIKDSMSFKFYTDSNGQATFEYLGEVTVVQAQMDGINPSQPVAIPKVPDTWVRETYISLIGGGVISGFFSALFGFMFERTLSKKHKVTRTSKKK